MNTFKHLATTVSVTLFVLSFNLVAQMDHDSMKPKGEQKSAAADTSLCSKSMNDVSEHLGKATFEQSVNGLGVKVWVITQEEHKKIMESMMKDSSMGGEKHEMGGMKNGEMKMKREMKGMDMKQDDMGQKEMTEKMTSGTHHIMAVLTDVKTGDPVKDAVIEVSTLSPSKKTSNSKLESMMGHFGGNLELGEKGDFNVALTIKVGGETTNVRFLYTVN